MRLRNILVLGAITLLTAIPCAAAPTQGTLTFTYSGDTGILRGTHKLNERPGKTCLFQVRASVYDEGRLISRGISRVIKQNQFRRQNNSFRASGLPPVSGKFGDAVLTLQAKTTCGKKVIVSNAVARFVKCGVGAEDDAVPPATFLSNLQGGIRVN